MRNCFRSLFFVAVFAFGNLNGCYSPPPGSSQGGSTATQPAPQPAPQPASGPTVTRALAPELDEMEVAKPLRSSGRLPPPPGPGMPQTTYDVIVTVINNMKGAEAYVNLNEAGAAPVLVTLDQPAVLVFNCSLYGEPQEVIATIVGGVDEMGRKMSRGLATCTLPKPDLKTGGGVYGSYVSMPKIQRRCNWIIEKVDRAICDP